VDSAVEMKEPLSKNRIKWLQSLTKKKVRDEEWLFFAEGVKLVEDLLPAFECHSIYATEDYFSSRGKVAALEGGYVVTKEELKRISAQCAPQSVFAVFKKRDAGFNKKTHHLETLLLKNCIYESLNAENLLLLISMIFPFFILM
jgi:TrmH family RNA methyltransferase